MSQPVGPSLPQTNNSCIFYKLMVPSILQDKKLRIPNKFVKKFGGELSSVATLAVPDGRRWLVELWKDNQRIWLDSGWNAFVEYYSICIGYFLVFKYEGNSHFDVNVYNLKASEIDYLSNDLNHSHKPVCCNPHLKDVEDGDFADKDVDECLDHDRKRYKNSTCLHQGNDPCDLRALPRSTRDKAVQFNGVELTSTGDEGGLCFLNETQRITKAIKLEPDMNMDEHEALWKIEVKEELPAPNSPSVPRRRRDVTAEEKQGAFRAASMFKPDNPFCRVILRPSYVYKGVLLHLPRCFAQKYLNGVDGIMTLQVSEGKKWPVQCVYCNGNLRFSKGWSEFVLDNNLEEGDVCIFEVINRKEMVLKVTIFRALQD
ncbi:REPRODUCTIVE MERISTEM 39, REDUCED VERNALIZATION RESPONSE 1 [Hibiscus trionum]|uniref:REPRODUCTIVE MERISTEM 39, REDUCED VERNALIZATION RESPONSE 1 n=1 Tax=Hibiscus trionum TaxID=183268 RepID=A0A9W7MPG9_HIBTR|nr:REPRODUCTIVE MERISTEM 39, REDUCED VERNALIZATION RESPONSE 1 [Hibiscus trionum]